MAVTNPHFCFLVPVPGGIFEKLLSQMRNREQVLISYFFLILFHFDRVNVV